MDTSDTTSAASNYRNSTYTQSTVLLFSSINDVKTFGQCVDFMHDTHCQSSYDSDDDVAATSRRISVFRQSKDKPQANVVLGEYLLSELELFRKTYIILHTHLVDCAKHLEKLHNKYVKKFLKSLNAASSSSHNANFDLMVTIACETTINGVLFAKIWSSIVKLNCERDQTLNVKCLKLASHLKLESSVDEFGPLCADYFKVERAHFAINTKSILRELKRLPFLNNPHEKLECIKTSVDLMNNELSVASKKKDTSVQLTSDLLIPLMAFVLLKSNIDCFKSIEFFLDNFQFSMSPDSYSKSHMSTMLAELSFFLTTFKAAVQLIEASHV